MSDTPRTDAAIETIIILLTEAVPIAFARELERENANLSAWKHGALTVDSWWKEVDDFIRSHPDAMVGRPVAEIALQWLKERDALLATNTKLREEVTKLTQQVFEYRERLADKLGW